MNLIRTIQAREIPAWVAMLFRPGPHVGPWVPLYPYMFPFPHRLAQHVAGGFLYVVYRQQAIGYGTIARVTAQRTAMLVGTVRQAVRPGDAVEVSGVLVHMPSTLQSVRVRGFMGARYTTQDLHTLRPALFRTALENAGIVVY